MAKSKSKSKSKGEVATIRRPPPKPRVDWRICINCGCYEPFQYLTEECCWNEFQKECVFTTTLASPQGPMPLAKGKPDQLQ